MKIKAGRQKKEKNSKIKLSAPQIIVGSFLTLIIIGTLLLMLPIARKGDPVSFTDTLFTATSSTCITGLLTVDMLKTWSFFGQLVILILIQLGGLGVITFAAVIMMVLGKRLSFRERLLIQESYSLNSYSGVAKLILRIVKGTAVVEGIGAFLYSFAFVPRFGFWRGIWVSIFNAISAFCNAGIDIINDTSLTEYVNSAYVNIITMILIVLGGLGFIVWWDVVDRIRDCIHGKIRRERFFHSLCLHTKLVLVTTFVLIVGGAMLIFFFEYNNKNTIGNFSFPQKILASLFQSVTLRTAGFAAIDESALTQDSAFLCCFLMFIGGSPVGTAGGVKTVGVALMTLTIISVIKGKERTEVFHKSISEGIIRRSFTIVSIGMFVLIFVTMLLTFAEQQDFVNLFFESSSALATVGLSMGVTPTLTIAGKYIIIIAMYIGRVGPVSLVMALRKKNREYVDVKYPKEDVLVG